MRNIKIFTYLKIILFLLLVFVAVYYPTNEFDVITSNLLQIKILGQTAKIISTIFNDKILLLIMVLLSAFLFWIKEAKKDFNAPKIRPIMILERYLPAI